MADQKRVLICGGAGFIGSHIVDALHERGYHVRIADDYSSGNSANPTAPVKHSLVDISAGRTEDNKDGIYGLIRSFRPDYICHQAAQPSLLVSKEKPIFDAMTNIIGTLRILQAAKEFGTKKIVFASTSAVYGHQKGSNHFTENLHPAPNAPYGISKTAAEYYIWFSGIPFVILRYANVYGPRQVPLGENQLIPRALAHVYQNEPFEIYGDGEQSRDLIYVKDVVLANILAIENENQGICNIASGKAVTVNSILAIIKKHTKFDGEFTHGEKKPGERRHVTMSNERANSLFGWRVTTPLEKGIKKTIEAWPKDLDDKEI